jgi:hypothetical protein
MPWYTPLLEGIGMNREVLTKQRLDEYAGELREEMPRFCRTLAALGKTGSVVVTIRVVTPEKVYEQEQSHSIPPSVEPT